MIVGSWTVRVDRERTLAAQNLRSSGAAEDCQCAGCRNFIAVGAGGFPAELLRLLDAFGVPLNRTSEVYHLHRVKPGRHLYGFWVHLFGTMEGPDCLREDGQMVLEPMGTSCRVGFSLARTLVPAELDDSPLLQFEVNLELPWVLGENELE